VAEFLTLDQSALLASLSARHERVMGMRPDGLQIAAWCGEYEILGVTLREIVASVPRAREWAVIFEYELPRERGRRPDVVILTGSGKDSWALMVGLIGEGQEIYLGEEAGLAQWNDAIEKTSDSWTVHCPRKIADIFESAERLEISESLDLDMSCWRPLSNEASATRSHWPARCHVLGRKRSAATSAPCVLASHSAIAPWRRDIIAQQPRRTHLAEDVQGWVQDLPEGRLEAAAAHAEAMEKQGFHLYLTRELERATGYVRERVAA